MTYGGGLVGPPKDRSRQGHYRLRLIQATIFVMYMHGPAMPLPVAYVDDMLNS